MNLENFATNLSNEPATQLLSKSNFIIIGYDKKGKNNFLNFFISTVLQEDQTSIILYINNPDLEFTNKRIALMGKNYISTIDFLYDIYLSRKKITKDNEQIYVVINDLNNLIKDPLIKYHKDSDHDESFTLKFHKLINEGHERKINFVLNSDNDQIPSQIKSGFLEYVIFKAQRKIKAEYTKLDLDTIKKDNQFIYNNNLFIINEKEYSFKLKEKSIDDSDLHKNIKKFISKILESDIKNLTNLSLTKNILIKLFCNYGATSVEEPKYKMSEINFNFSYGGSTYSIFIYNKNTKKDLKNALDLAIKLEKSHKVVVANITDHDLPEVVNQKHFVLNKKDLVDLIKYKIDEDEIKEQEVKDVIVSRLKFFN